MVPSSVYPGSEIGCVITTEIAHHLAANHYTDSIVIVCIVRFTYELNGVTGIDIA